MKSSILSIKSSSLNGCTSLQLHDSVLNTFQTEMGCVTSCKRQFRLLNCKLQKIHERMHQTANLKMILNLFPQRLPNLHGSELKVKSVSIMPCSFALSCCNRSISHRYNDTRCVVRARRSFVPQIPNDEIFILNSVHMIVVKYFKKEKCYTINKTYPKNLEITESA